MIVQVAVPTYSASTKDQFLTSLFRQMRLAAKKKRDSVNQPKLTFKNGQLSLNFEHDKAMQERWDCCGPLHLRNIYKLQRSNEDEHFVESYLAKLQVQS